MWLKIAPYIFCVVFGAAMAFGIVKYTQPTIKVDCPACPSLKCPEPPASNGIDFDKIKNVKGLTIQNHQYFVVGNDSVTMEALTAAFRKVALEQKLSRCK
jgi:hypothetical protein